MGDCVVEMQRNDLENRTSEVRLVGITIHNRQTNNIIGFDRYHATLKRVKYEPSNNIKKYIPFIKHLAEGWTFRKNNSTVKTKDFAYCKVIFLASK